MFKMKDLKKIQEFFSKPINEEEKSFADYSNNELAAYLKNNPTDTKASSELHKRSQKLKALTRTDESVNEGMYKKEGWLVKSNDDDTKYIVVHTSDVENKSNRISDIYKDKKLAIKRAAFLNKKLRGLDESILSEKKPSKIVWDTKKISAAKRINVRKWYMKTYPIDELGGEINQKLTLWDVYTYLSQGYDVYKVIGVSDSVIRERVFEKLSKVLDVDYDTIYNMFESVNEAQFKDLQIGDEFLRFGKNGQLWVKTSDRQAKFVKNVGKKTAKYNKSSGSLEVFPPTMDITLESVNEATPIQKIFRKIGWGGDWWTPQDYAKQIKNLPDNTLKIWYNSAKSNKGIPNTPLAFQQKLTKIEMEKRGLLESVYENNLGHAEVRKVEKNLSLAQKEELSKLIKSGKIKTSDDLKNWLPSIKESINEQEYAKPSISDYKVGDILKFKDGEEWLVVKPGMRGSSNRRNSDEITIKPYNKLAKDRNVSLAIDATISYLNDVVDKIIKKSADNVNEAIISNNLDKMVDLVVEGAEPKNVLETKEEDLQLKNLHSKIEKYYGRKLEPSQINTLQGKDKVISNLLSQYRKLSRSLNEQEEDPIDIITMDVPLFIRVLEYAREDAQADMDLHDLTEKAIAATKQQGILQMDDYDMLVGELEQLNEEFLNPGKRPIITNKQGEKFVLQGFTIGGYYLIPYDGYKYWEHFRVPKEQWIPEKSINWGDYNFTQQQFEKLKAFNSEKEKEVNKKFQDMNEIQSLEDQAKVYWMQQLKAGKIDKLPKDPKEAFLIQMMKDQIDHDEETLRRERGLEEKIREIIETIKLGQNLNESTLCKRGQDYIKARKAAGEKSSAYLSGRAVKVCKGDIKFKGKKQKDFKG